MKVFLRISDGTFGRRHSLFAEDVKLGGWKSGLLGSSVCPLGERSLAENEANTRNQNPEKENERLKLNLRGSSCA